jgi:hypothetical protein
MKFRLPHHRRAPEAKVKSSTQTYAGDSGQARSDVSHGQKEKLSKQAAATLYEAFHPSTLFLPLPLP